MPKESGRSYVSMSRIMEVFGGVPTFAAIAAGVVLLLLLLILINVAGQPGRSRRQTRDIESVRQDVERIGTDVQSGLGGIREEMGSLEGGFVALGDEVRSLRQDITVLGHTYATLEQDYASLEEKLDELSDRERFVSSVADVSEQVAALALPYDEYIEKYFFGIDRDEPDTYEESDRNWPVFPGDPMPEVPAERKPAPSPEPAPPVEREGLTAEPAAEPVPEPEPVPAYEPAPVPTAEPEPASEPAEAPAAGPEITPAEEPVTEPGPAEEPGPAWDEEPEEEPYEEGPGSGGFRIPSENPFPDAKPSDLSRFLAAQSPAPENDRVEQGVTTVEEILSSMARDLGEIPRTGLENLITPDVPVGIPSNPYDITDTGRSGKHYSLDELEAQIRE